MVLLMTDLEILWKQEADISLFLCVSSVTLIICPDSIFLTSSQDIRAVSFMPGSLCLLLLPFETQEEEEVH